MKRNKEEALKAIKLHIFNGGSFGRTFENIEKVIEHLDQEQLTTAYNEYAEQVKEHKTKRGNIIHNNMQIKKDFLAFIDNHEHIDRINVGRKRTKNRKGEMYAHWNKVIADLQAYVPNTINIRPIDQNFTFDFVYASAPRRLDNVTIETFFERVVSAIKRINHDNAAKSEKYNAALEYIKTHKLDDQNCILPKDFIAICNEHARDIYCESLRGEEIGVTHSDGDDCTWEVGDHRCECGVNRYYLEINGDFHSGFDSYGKWC
jgi:hypothetical protein